MIQKTVITKQGEYKDRVSEMHLKLRDQQLEIIYIYTNIYIYIYIYRHIYIYIYILKPHGNCKPKIYNTSTHKKEKGIQT